MKLLDEARQDFDLFYNDNARYQANVNRVSDLLQLSGGSALRSEILPTYMVGDYHDQRKIVVLGMNPHFDEERNRIEEAYKNGTWKKYDNFIRTFFSFFKTKSVPSEYFSRLGRLFSGIERRPPFTLDESYAYDQQNLINIDLVPYHSATFNPRPTNGAQNYLFARLERMLSFVEGVHPRIMFFNGGLYYELMKQRGFLKETDSQKIGRVRVYWFRYEGTPSLLFTGMITSFRSGVTFNHLEMDIPRLIRDQFGSLSNENKRKAILIKQFKRH